MRRELGRLIHSNTFAETFSSQGCHGISSITKLATHTNHHHTLGYITAVSIGLCGGANDASILSLPWHIQYRTFIGTLPNIIGAGVDIVGFAGNFDFPLVGDCLYLSTSGSPARMTINVSGGVAKNLFHKARR